MLLKPEKTSLGIKTLKLTTGEEIIAQVSESKGTRYDVFQPLMFVLSNTQNEHGSSDVIFAPWIISLDFTTSVSISESNVVAICEVSDIAKEKYNEALNKKN